LSNLSRSKLWQFSKKIHEEIHFQTQLATGISTKVETIEKYEKNLKILSIYNMYILFILFMAGLMNYVTFMRGDYFKLLRPLPLSSRDMTQLTFYVFFRMNAIQLTFILFALPVVGLILTLSPLTFFILLLNNLINLGFIVPVLIIVAWILAQKVFNKAEKSPIGPIITVLTMVVYILTVIPIFFLMSSFYHIINQLFNSTLITGKINQKINFLLSLIPFPFSSNYLTTLVLLLPSGSISFPLTLQSVFGVCILLSFIVVAFRKGSSLIQKLAFEPAIERHKVFSEKDVVIQVKTSTLVVTFMKKTLTMVFRDYGALTLFVLGLLMPLIIFMYSFAMPERYIGSDRGTLWFIITMLVFLVGFQIFILYNSLRLSERNLGGLLSTLPFKERDLFRSKQFIISIACLLPILFFFLLFQEFMTIGMLYALIKIFFVNIITVYVFLILHAFFFGKINNRYTFTIENIENQIRKWIAIFVGLYSIILGYFKLTEIISESILRNWEIGFIILTGMILTSLLELITKRMFV